MMRADSLNLDEYRPGQQRTGTNPTLQPTPTPTPTPTVLPGSAAPGGPTAFWDQGPVSNRLFEVGQNPEDWLSQQPSDAISMNPPALPTYLPQTLPGPVTVPQFHVEARWPPPDDAASLYSESSYISGIPGGEQLEMSPSNPRRSRGPAVADTPPTTMTRENSALGSSVYGGFGMLRVSSHARSDTAYHGRHNSFGTSLSPALLRTLSVDLRHGVHAQDTQQIGAHLNPPQQPQYPPSQARPAPPSSAVTAGALEPVAEDMRRSGSNQSMQSTSSRRSVLSLQASVANAQRQRIQPRGRGGSSVGRTTAPRRKPKTRRRQARPPLPTQSSTEQASCAECNLTFRAEHEKRRHVENQHGPGGRWQCIDVSPDGSFLADCERCKQGKLYKTNYGAAAHLRRRHFNKRGGTSARGSTVGRGGNSGGKQPPLDVLRQEGWVQKVAAPDDQGQGGAQDDAGGNAVDFAVATEVNWNDVGHQREDEAVEQSQTFPETSYPQAAPPSQQQPNPNFNSAFTSPNDPPQPHSPPSFWSPSMMRQWPALVTPPDLSSLPPEPPQVTGFDMAQPAMGLGLGMASTGGAQGMMASPAFISPPTNAVDRPEGNPPTTVDPSILDMPTQQFQYSAFLANSQESAVSTGSSQFEDLVFSDYNFDDGSFSMEEDLPSSQ